MAPGKDCESGSDGIMRHRYKTPDSAMKDELTVIYLIACLVRSEGVTVAHSDQEYSFPAGCRTLGSRQKACVRGRRVGAKIA